MTDYAADGYLGLYGPCIKSDDPLPDYALVGNFAISSPAMTDTILPPRMDAAAAGSLEVSGLCGYRSQPPEIFVAAGHLALGGSCAATNQQPPVTGDFSEERHQAAGSFVISGQSEADSIVPPVGVGVASGSFQIGGFPGCAAQTIMPAEISFAARAKGALELFGPCTANTEKAPVTGLVANFGVGAPVFLISSNCAGATLYPPSDAFQAMGGLALVNPVVTLTPDIFETWAMTGQLYEPGLFTNFDFNSFCVHQGHTYGCKEDGIYLLEGDDDDGQEIHDGVRLGPHNFGVDREKRLRALRLTAMGNVKVRITAGKGDLAGEIQDKQEGYYDSVDGHVPVTRDLQGREWVIEIADFKQLSQVEIIPLILWKR